LTGDHCVRKLSAMYVSFISGKSAHKTNKQTNEQADRWTGRLNHTQANYDEKCSNTQLSY